ncbi:hypothetical protein SAMN06265365_13514 [Tistlia consotensis]|uniref:Uncharacterized protein n=1 Tax=Tistlia consotensis USBA 355 TaxID=560819 RepID=A0A1Y6CUV0_9PROT|nr:hypothetical protein [Tistlia consotensis]SMF79826.1 hypothetical protein SAMN05428998_14037 [Tistlia consotensis USBA 355]SNS16583.1 hypothetical protein SAMN06265365_13514 [Tistlia consotensis]
MQIVLEAGDFRRLSATAQQELLALFGGGAGAPAPDSELRWRAPYPLTHEQAARLVRSLPGNAQRRLALFANRNGRVKMKELMAVDESKDLRTTTRFVRDMATRLRRMVDDPEKKAQLIQWDFDATRWDKTQQTIVDGVYYVAPETAQALREAFDQS